MNQRRRRRVSWCVAPARRVWVGPFLSLVAANGLFAVLAAAAGLTFAGWAVGFAYALVVGALLSRGLTASGALGVGPANAVTLARSTVVAGVAALVTTAVQRPAATATIVTLAAIALALDGLDGWVARHTRSATAFGARFDGEVDAFLILALSVQVARSLAWWVLAIGLMRYALWFAGVTWPWFREVVPPRYWRKVVCAVQGIVLTVAIAGIVPRSVALVAAGVALILLAESFGRDALWLVTRRRELVESAAANRRLRSVVVAAVTAVAVALFWVALVGPDRQSQLTVSTFLRVPLEGVAIVAVALMLPPRLRTAMAVVVGLLLSVLTVARVVNIGFFEVLDRPFNPVTDWPSFPAALSVFRDSVGRTTALATEILAIAAVPVVVIAVTTATIRVTRLAARHRGPALRMLAGLSAVWVVCLALGTTTGSGLPVDSTSAARLTVNEVHLIDGGLRDRGVFNKQLAAYDPYAAEPTSQLLTGLRGKDVLIVFVESYGQVAVQGTPFSGGVDAAVRQDTAALQAAGFSARSAFLTSPTFGGISWLAHSTLESGMWVDNQQRYSQLTASGRFNLFTAFNRAGWRTVVDIPSSPSPWQQGRGFYHFDKMYGINNVGYLGPHFSYAKIPDQYTLEAFYRRELAPQHRKPVMAEIDLDSSHTPWAPLPSMVPWRDLGDGAIYGPMATERPGPSVVWRSASGVQAAYGQSIQYSMAALTSFIRRVHDNKLVVIALGDHQPATVVSGDTANHDVPITIITHAPKILDAVDPWRWEPGLLPSPHAPVWPMSAFRNRFLTAYGAASSTIPAASAAASSNG
jgi:phosphatidylglycerophosphate synthase